MISCLTPARLDFASARSPGHIKEQPEEVRPSAIGQLPQKQAHFGADAS